jgi:hypothetical protein
MPGRATGHRQACCCNIVALDKVLLSVPCRTLTGGGRRLRVLPTDTSYALFHEEAEVRVVRAIET